jgi:hypothetical protein
MADKLLDSVYLLRYRGKGRHRGLPLRVLFIHIKGLAVAELLLFAFVPVLDGAEETNYAGVGFNRGGAFGVLLFFRHF